MTEDPEKLNIGCLWAVLFTALVWGAIAAAIWAMITFL